MAGNRAEQTSGGAAKNPPSDALDLFLAEWAALDSPPWEDDAVSADRKTGGTTPPVEGDQHTTTEAASGPAVPMPRDEARSADLGTGLEQMHSRLAELDETTTALKRELDSLRVLRAQLTSEYEAAIHRIASQAQDRSVAVGSSIDAVQQPLPSPAVQENLAPMTDDRFDVLKKRTHEVSARTDMLYTKHGIRDDAEKEARALRAALTEADVPERRTSLGRFAARVAGAWLLIGVIGFLVIAAVVKRNQAQADKPPTAITAEASLSHEANTVPATDAGTASSQQTPGASPSSGVRPDGKFRDQSSRSVQRGERAASSSSPIGTSAPMETLPQAAPRDNTSQLSGSLPPPNEDLSGWWMLTNEIEESSVNAYNDLTLGFSVQLDQIGNRVSGKGFKLLENGRPVASRSRVPITVYGTVAGSRLALTFTERGARRTSRGSLQMELMHDGSLDGRFASDAAGSRGRAHAVRMPTQQQ